MSTIQSPMHALGKQAEVSASLQGIKRKRKKKKTGAKVVRGRTGELLSLFFHPEMRRGMSNMELCGDAKGKVVLLLSMQGTT